MRLALVATLVGCGSSRPAPAPLANQAATTTVRVAIADGSELSVVDVTPSGAQVVRKATLPSRIDTLAWLGEDPIVLIQRGTLENCGLPEEAYGSKKAYEAAQRDCEVDARHDGTIGRLTTTGFVAYPPLPDSTWDLLKQPKNVDPCTTECWSLSLVGREVWQGHCKWSFSADGRQICDEWAYARIDVPGPATMKAPKAPATPEPTLPTIEPPSNVSVTFDNITPPPRYDGDEPEAQPQLQCAIDDKHLLSYPDAKDLDAGMRPSVTWLAATPPMFAAWHVHEGFDVTQELLIFDSCKPTRYQSFVAGPDGLVALVGPDRIEIRRNGVLLGTTHGGDQLEFAPSRPAAEL